MQLGDARTAYGTLSGKVSDIVRQMSLAGIALIWLFRATPASPGRIAAINPELLRAALFVFLAITFDFLQYLTGTATRSCISVTRRSRRPRKDMSFRRPRRSTGRRGLSSA